MVLVKGGVGGMFVWVRVKLIAHSNFRLAIRPFLYNVKSSSNNVQLKAKKRDCTLISEF